MVRLLLFSGLVGVSDANSFNPTMVRLLLERGGAGNGPAWVSIPQWCDCCSQPVSKETCPIAVSIPQWCDCCKLLCLQLLPLKPCFNPTMVRLLLDNFGLTFGSARCFNPTMVRLLPS